MYVFFQTSDEFIEAYNNHTNVSLSSFARFAYDSVWTVAMTLRKTQERQRRETNVDSGAFDSFGYQTESGHALRTIFREEMGKLNFMGISVGAYVVDYEISNKTCNIVLVLCYDSTKHQLNELCIDKQSPWMVIRYISRSSIRP